MLIISHYVPVLCSSYYTGKKRQKTIDLILFQYLMEALIATDLALNSPLCVDIKGKI